MSHQILVYLLCSACMPGRRGYGHARAQVGLPLHRVCPAAHACGATAGVRSTNAGSLCTMRCASPEKALCTAGALPLPGELLLAGDALLRRLTAHSIDQVSPAGPADHLFRLIN